MSNILKSKFLLGIMIVAVAVAGLAMFAVTANAQQPVVSASDIQYAATVQLGSSGQASLIWQKFLNHYSSANLVADGKFGPLSTAALKVWQASRSLAVDGIAGPASRASAVAQINSGVVIPVGGTFPAGCSSSAGYSVTTGLSCAGSTTLPAGCTSTAGYSPTTGAKCSGGSTPSTNGPLTGSGAGSITVDSLSSFSAEEVGEGEENAEVMEFEVAVDADSDIMVTSMKVEFDQATAADSTDLEDYASSISIWFDGEKVGEADAEDFTEVDATDSWTKSIAIDDVVIDADEEGEFTIAVTAQNSLDSGDIDTDAWTVDVLNIRFEDWEGVVTTEDTDGDTLEKTFDFASFASSADINLKITLGDEEIYESHVINIDNADTTEEVELHSFMLEAEGDSDILIKDLPITINSVEATGNDPDDLISQVYLFADGEQVGVESLVTSDADDSTEVVVFENVDFTIEAGDEVEFVVKADIKATSTALDDGDTIAVVFGETETDLATFDAEDEEGEELVDADVTGTATGQAHSVRDVGMSVEFVSATSVLSHAADLTVSTDDDQGTFAITFDVTAFDGPVYLDGTSPTEAGTAEHDLSITGSESVLASSIRSSTGATLTGTLDTTSTYTILEGDTERFTITVTLAPTADGYFEVAITDLIYDIVAAGTTGTNAYTFNLAEFKTPQLFLNQN